MNSLGVFTFKALRKIYKKCFGNVISVLKYEQNPDKVSQDIYDSLIADKPCMIARFGAFELAIMANYLGVKRKKRKLISYIQGKEPDFFWNKSLLNAMSANAGFFPLKTEYIEKFCELMIQDSYEVDILGSWQQNELYFEKELYNSKKIMLMYLDPYWTKQPWTKALENKKILIVHPFAKSIKTQYDKRELLHKNKEVLPTFKLLTIVQAVQSIGIGDDRFKDWFDALDFMKKEIEKSDFEICLIGCGAYGFPLAAHVKRMGKKAVHIGGSLQLLFGIKGKRWETDKPHYVDPGNVFIHYSGLANNYWVRPLNDEKPEAHKQVEDSCYW